MMSEQSKPIGDVPTPPFLVLERALKETLSELCRNAQKMREKGTPLSALQILDDARRSFKVVFVMNKKCFPKTQHSTFDVFCQRTGSMILAVEQLILHASVEWLESALNKELLALEHLKLNLNAVLADAQSKFMQGDAS